METNRKGVDVMEKTNNWRERISEKLPILVFAFCIIQPLLDIAGYWQDRLGVANTATMLLRMALLGGSVLLGFVLSDRKRYYYITAAVLLLLTGGHILACRQNVNGYREPFNDLLNLVRIYFLPMTTLCFITFLRQNEKVLSAIRKGMLASLGIVVLVQILSLADPCETTFTYSVDRIGVLGWFMWTNSQSAILAMLAPISICWTIRRWEGKWLPVAVVTVFSEAALFFLAPRLSYFSLIFCGAGVFVCLLIANRKLWKQGVVVLLITALFTAAYPWSPTYARLNKNNVRVEESQKQIKKDLDNLPVVETETNEEGEPEPVEPEAEKSVEEARRKQLEKIYKRQAIIWSMVQRFGFDKVYEVYDETTDAYILSSTRTMKINFCRLLMQESGTLSHLFGLNLKEMTHQRQDKDGILVTDNYDVENDFHGIYFLTGLVGLGLMILFLLYFGLRALWAIIRDPKHRINLTMASFLMAYAIGVAHAYFTASVLRRNNASVYLAMVLAGLWFLSRSAKDRKPVDVHSDGQEAESGE